MHNSPASSWIDILEDCIFTHQVIQDETGILSEINYKGIFIIEFLFPCGHTFHEKNACI